MITEILTNILGQNGYTEALWLFVQFIFFAIIFLMPLEIRKYKKEMKEEFGKLRQEIIALETVKGYSDSRVETDDDR